MGISRLISVCGVSFFGDYPVGTRQGLLQLARIQGIGQIDPQPFPKAKTVGPAFTILLREVQGGQLHSQFQVGHGIGRHKQFKPKQSLEQVVFNVAVPTYRPG